MTPANHLPSRDGSAGRGAHHDPTTEEMRNADVAYEHSDINVRAVLAFAAGLVVVTAIAFVVVWGLFTVLQHQAAANDPQVTPLAVPAGSLPPEPRLQTNEPAGLEKFRATETQTLEGYGWVDQKAGIARMPIEEAKKLIVQRGLPVRAGNAPDPLLGTHAAAMGEASSGRNLPHATGAAPAAGNQMPRPKGGGTE